jgi:hypothetical protein
VSRSCVGAARGAFKAMQGCRNYTAFALKSNGRAPTRRFRCEHGRCRGCAEAVPPTRYCSRLCTQQRPSTVAEWTTSEWSL